jgi:hypothetical protein
MSIAPAWAGLGFIIVVVVYALLAFVLYLIIRFGVKHGMRSYYAEANRRPDPED